MATIAVWVKIDGEHLADSLLGGRDRLDGADGEVVFDFSSVRRVDPGALRAMEEVARAADEKTVKVVLRGVNIDVYKVLKLVNLTPRFSFMN